jgi:hypothetical protein
LEDEIHPLTIWEEDIISQRRIMTQPILFFSVLPTDLFEDFERRYLAKECNIIWSKLQINRSTPLKGNKELFMPYCASHGYIKLLEYGVGKGLKVTGDVWCKAVIYDRVDIVKWFISIGIPLYLGTIGYAIENGRLEIVKWLYEVNPDDVRFASMAVVARNGHIHVLEWMLTIGRQLNENVFSSAIESRSIPLLEWLYAHKCPWTEQVYHYACEGGYNDVVKWLHGKNAPGSLLDIASDAGNLPILEWLDPHIDDLRLEHTTRAAQNGDVDVLFWLIERGCPWDKQVCIEGISESTGDDEVIEQLNAL